MKLSRSTRLIQEINNQVPSFEHNTRFYFELMFGNKNESTSDDFYTNAEGYRVFTEKYHLKRGYCCKNGCKHCPYGYDKNTDAFR